MKKKTNENTEVQGEAKVVDKLESLNGFVNAIINKNDDEAKAHFSAYSTTKAREIIGGITEHAQVKDEEEDEDEDEDDQSSKYSHLLKNRDKKKAPLKKMKKVDEAALKEFTGDESPIRLKGDDVFVNNKLVGTVQTDLSSAASGIEFTAADGSVTEHFETIKELYRYLIETFKVNSEIPLDDDEE
jgi:hypothetical protein